MTATTAPRHRAEDRPGGIPAHSLRFWWRLRHGTRLMPAPRPTGAHRAEEQ